MKVEMRVARSPQGVQSAARRAAEVLRAGGLVIHPTETVYGIGGDASAASNDLIASLKKRRGSERPLILLTLDLAAVAALVEGLEWPDEAAALAERFWPGPLTLVVSCTGAPRGLQGAGAGARAGARAGAGAEGGIALRVTSDPCVRAILEEWEGPMTSTSANLAGRRPARTVEDAAAMFEARLAAVGGAEPALFIDAGETPGAEGSTIVSFVGAPPRLLRAGPISLRELKEVTPQIRGRA
ncbi:MAG: L-threonylcarbamoyladenylate synthase [Candidatus Palauibacterales bacterium]|nr:L-threonylcarbamoyladenylate synthase [Candidatus Palauibacterales bacterium]